MKRVGILGSGIVGILYVGGSAEIDDFPGTASGAEESYAGGDYDGFLAALTSDLVQLPTVSVDDVAGLELGDATGSGTILNDDRSLVEIPTLSPAALAGLALALAAAAPARVRRGNH